MNQTELKLANKIASNIEGAAFQKAPRDRQGNLILRRPALIQNSLLVGLVITLLALCSVFVIDDMASEKEQYLSIFVPCLLFFAFLYITMKVSKTVIGQDGVTTIRITGKKHIHFDQIEHVSYSPLFMGCAVLLGANGAILRVPLSTTGFSEFYELLKNKVAADRIHGMDVQLNERNRSK